MSEDYKTVKELYHRCCCCCEQMKEMKHDLKDLLDSFDDFDVSNTELKKEEKIVNELVEDAIEDAVEDAIVDSVEDAIVDSVEDEIIGGKKNRKKMMMSKKMKIEKAKEKYRPNYIRTEGGRSISEEQRKKMQEGASKFREFSAMIKTVEPLRKFKGKGIRTAESLLYELKNDSSEVKLREFINDLISDYPNGIGLNALIDKLLEFRLRNDLGEGPKLNKALRK
jgi:hypothetical protein